MMPSSLRRSGGGSCWGACLFALSNVALALLVSSVGCGEEKKLPPRSMTTGAGGGGGEGLSGGTGGGPPDPDAGGYCGNEVHKAIDAPNLYFVLDASGSMLDASGTGTTRYGAVRLAVVDLVRKLGPFVNVGAAILPSHKSFADQCDAGGQVFPVQQGDPITGKDGPTTIGFWQATSTTPAGGTPISGTIEALTPTLLGLKGETYVVIATDGGPNCNDMAACDASRCMLNIEGECMGSSVNCCALGEVGGPTFCVDDTATVAAIEVLAKAGLHVIVVGIPGSETYADVLDAMAVAGNSPKTSTPFYYPVAELASLSEVLGEIGKVAITCDFELADPPTEPGMTNVYVDDKVLPYAIDGWTWATPSTVRLLGATCDKLKNGQIAKVQIVSGCPTEVPK